MMSDSLYDHYLCMTENCKYTRYIMLYSGKVPAVPTCSECGAPHVKKVESDHEETLNLALGLKKE